MFRLEAGEREHAALLGDMGEALVEPVRGQRLDEVAAQAVDAPAHLVELFVPQGGELVGVEDGGHDGAAVGRRVGVVLARGDRQLRAHVFHVVGVLGDGDEAAGAFAIDAEVLRAGLGDDHLVERVRQQAHAIGVFVEAVAEALVGEVHERQQLAFLDHGQHLLPLVLGQIEAGRVVTAGVQQHDVTFRNLLERAEHAVEIEPVVGIDIGILFDVQPGRTEHAEMVRPGRVGQPDRLARQVGLDEVRSQTQRAGAARRLGRARAVVGQHLAVGAEHRAQDVAAVFRIAVRADIGLGLFVLDEQLLGFLDRAHDRRDAGFVAIDADAEIDLVRVAVVLEGLDQPENGIAGDSLNRFEHPVAFLVFRRARGTRALTSWRSLTPATGRCRMPERAPRLALRPTSAVWHRRVPPRARVCSRCAPRPSGARR